MNGYDLSREWFDFSFENPDRVKPIHGIIYFWAIEQCNRLGWKKIFGFPTSFALEATGIKSYASYKKHFDELVDFGFIKVHQYSKNSVTSNIIELTFNAKAGVKAKEKALNKALSTHASKQVKSKRKSIDSIDKPINNKPIKQQTTNNDIVHSEIIKIFNEVCFELPSVQSLSDKRKESLNYLIENYELNKIGDVFRNVSKSDFLIGKNKDNWKATFDWIIKKDNFIKILEDNYKNRTNGTTTKKSNVNYSAEFLEKHFGNLQP